jgi:nicotinamidase-related amidase
MSPLVSLPVPTLNPEGSALLVVDVQFFDAHREYGMGRASPGEMDEYFEQVDEIVPRIRSLQDAARGRGLRVIHTRLCSHLPEGRDMCPSHRARGWRYGAGSQEAEFLPEVAPLADELVFDKTSSGAFNSGGLEQVLRYLGIERLIVCGVDTRYCVETTVRDASDRGFEVVLVSDACASETRALHEAGVSLLHNSYCVALTANEVIARITASAPVPVSG